MKRGLILLSTLLLVGCSNSKAEKDETNSPSESKISTSSTTTVSSTTSQKKVENSSTTSSSTSMTLETTSLEGQSYPYEVDFETFSSITSFFHIGVNLPNTISFQWSNPENGQITFTKDMFNTNYAVSYKQIPAQAIRIFSADSNANDIRTVNVNTEIVLEQRLQSTDDREMKGNLYAFINKNGGVSLVTPNYAGNVETNNMDVMVEYLPQ